MKQLPDIFNDVIGPVMRGPSSSHTAASWRIAKTCLDILNEIPKKALIEFDRGGAWAPNYREQGTCMGIDGGLLGLEITDEQMKNTHTIAHKKGIQIVYQVSSFSTNHANTVRLTLSGETGKKVQITAASTGGGAFEIQSFNGFGVRLKGDCYVVLLIAEKQISFRHVLPEGIELQVGKKGNASLLEFRSSEQFSSDFLDLLKEYNDEERPIVIYPVLPVIKNKQKTLPFDSIDSLVSFAEETNKDLGELGLIYEKHLSGLPDQTLTKMMEDIIQVIHNSIDKGLAGTSYKDRILHHQSHLIAKAEKKGKINSSVVNRIIANVTAIMESKSAMEVIVAVPTAGSCGTVGGCLRAIAEDINANKEELVKAYFAAGIVGACFAMGPGFSAEEHGCQVECGAASGMAAAAIAQLYGATAKEAIGAASMAIQNMIGMVCDPVADRVEVPCLGKNISAAVNAHSSAIMAISGYDAVIPLDQVIETVATVSKTMPNCVKCTGKGGLAITGAAIKIKKKMETK